MKNYTHSDYKQNWIDLRNSKRDKIGRTRRPGGSERDLEASSTDLGRVDLEKELKKENVNVMFLKSFDVLIFNEKPVDDDEPK